MEAMAEGLRGDLGQVTAAHAGLYRQLNEQSESLAVIKAAADAPIARTGAPATTIATATPTVAGPRKRITAICRRAATI